ncbi:MAG: hypothetical protein EOP45_23725 [Sphingobacteriaceae bacterium]|nr:MAG: hypothetical protein EOP45_23725 [Sphingobacteriaceae bacterium]
MLTSSIARNVARPQPGVSSKNFHFFVREAEDLAYETMLFWGRRDNKEVVSYLVSDVKTGQQGVLVLPWRYNQEGRSEPDYHVNIPNKTITDDDGRVFNMLKMVHVHPRGEHAALSSPEDRRWLNTIGLPGYILTSGFLYRISLDPNINDYNAGPTDMLLPAPALRQKGVQRPSLFPSAR